MSRIIFVNRFFAPDHSATSQLLTDLAFHLAVSHPVQVITSNQIFDDPQRRLPDEELIDNVQIHRVAATSFGRSRLLGRVADYLSLYWAFWRSLNRLVQTGDILVAKTDPPLLSVVVARICQKKNAKLINWVQDLYPEIAVELGVLPRPLARPLAALRDRSLRQARFNIVLGHNMAEKVAARNVNSDAIAIIPNWCDDQNIRPINHENNPLRKQWGVENSFVIGYSGNLGRAHEYQTILNAAALLAHRRDIVFLMIGGGYGVEKFKAEIIKQKLENKFLFKPYQSRNALDQSLGVSDVHWVSLLPNLEGLIVPSKIYGILAAGRPMLAITSKASDVARLVEQSGCGLVVTPGDGEGLARLIESCADDTDRVRAMGSRARQWLDSNCSMEIAFSRWQAIFAALNRPPG